MRFLSVAAIFGAIAVAILVATSVSRAGLRAVLLLLLLALGLGSWVYRGTLDECAKGTGTNCKFFGYEVPGSEN